MGRVKRGISLIVLIITVIVLAILATTVIISLSNTNIISEANETIFRSDMQSFKEVYTFYLANKLAEDKSLDTSTINAVYGDETFTEIFGDNVKTKYQAGLQVKSGRLIYDTSDVSKKAIVEELGMGLTIDASQVAIGSTVAYTPTADPNGSYEGPTVTDEISDGNYVIATTNYTPGVMEWTYLGQTNDGKIQLVAKNATSFNVALGCINPNNIGENVALIDELCNLLYGNSTYGTTYNYGNIANCWGNSWIMEGDYPYYFKMQSYDEDGNIEWITFTTDGFVTTGIHERAIRPAITLNSNVKFSDKDANGAYTLVIVE